MNKFNPIIIDIPIIIAPDIFFKKLNILHQSIYKILNKSILIIGI